ncbi:hypothetical protein J7L48_07430 [bacterium]|nr:hypothetical protein [bacterium]
MLYLFFIIINLFYTKNIEMTLGYIYLLIFVILMKDIVKEFNVKILRFMFFIIVFFIIVYALYEKFILFPQLRQMIAGSELINGKTFVEYLERGRVMGTFISPNILAIVPPLLIYYIYGKNKFFNIIFTGIFILMLFLTKSFNLVLFYFIVVLLYNKKKLVFLLIVVLILSVGSLTIIRHSDLSKKQMDPVVNRYKNFKAGIKMFFHRPIQGFGTFSYEKEYNRFKDKDANNVKMAHNVIIQHLADGGLLYLGLLIYMLIYIFKRVSYHEAIPLIAILVHNLFSFSFYSSTIFILFFLYFYVSKRKVL